MTTYIPKFFRNIIVASVCAACLAGTYIDSFAAYRDMDQFVRRAQKATEEHDYPMAIGMYSQLLKEYRTDAPKEDQLKYADDFQAAFDLCMADNRFIEALDFATHGLKASQNGGDVLREIRFMGNIGNLHTAFDDFERAVYYYKKGYRLALENDLPDLQWKFLVNLIPSTVHLGDVPKAKEYFTKMKFVAPADTVGSSFYNNYLQALIANADRQPDIAQYYHRQALDLAVRLGISDGEINELWELGNTFYAQERLDSAKHYYMLALEKTKNDRLSGHLAKIYLSLADVAKMEGDTAANMKYKSLHSEAMEQFFNPPTFNAKRNQLLEYEELVKDISIDDLNRKVIIQKAILISGAIIMVIVAVFFFLLRKRIKALRYANTKLIDRNRELIKVEEINRKLMDQQLANTPEKEADNELPAEDSASMPRAQYLSPEQTDILLRRIRKVLNESQDPFNQDFSLNSLAQSVKSNTKYVSWVINETYGKNFKTLLNEIRVREASKMLEDHETYGNYTIQAISEEVGYKSSTNFIIAFKKLVGMTPSVYQKLSAGEQDGEGIPNSGQEAKLSDMNPASND